MFAPRLAIASLSGESDAAWATRGAPFAGAAFLGGIALCKETRRAARAMVARGRNEFLPEDPIAFVDAQLAALEATSLRPGVNVRTTADAPLGAAASVCAHHDAILELNAHCRQDEMCAVGAGESLLSDPDRLAHRVRIASREGADVSVKVRAEVPGVDLAEVARAIETAGGAAIHVDAMDDPASIERVASATDLFVIANNGVRTAADVAAYVDRGADAVSVGRASDRPATLRVVRDAISGRSAATIDRKPSPG